MIAPNSHSLPRASTYPDGRVYSPARGRFAPTARIEDRLELAAAVVQGYPQADEFLEKIVREMRIRFYQPNSVKNYRNALRSFLNWHGGLPHLNDRAKFWDSMKTRVILSAAKDLGGTAIPGEVPLSGACGGIQSLGLEDTQVT